MERKRRKYCCSDRNSFDRFGDDLCEEILQYLSFEDKIRFECVSKQWKTLIYRRQHVLHVCIDKRMDTTNGLLANKLLSYYDENFFVKLKNVSIIERVLQKCPQIMCLIIPSNIWLLVVSVNHDQLLRIIANCANLVSIQKLVVRTITDTTLLPNLREITELTLDQRYELKETFNRYKATLKVFDAHFCGNGCDGCYALFEQLSKLTKLETLKLKMFNGSNINLSRFTDGFAKIGANCALIKHLSVQANNGDNVFHALLTAINSFVNLNYLGVNLINLNTNDDSFGRNISVNLMRNCVQLKRLAIDSVIDAKFFVSVDRFLPQLEVIKISTNKCITDEMINNFANLKKLRAININSKSNDGITDTGICKLINSCSQFCSFAFNPCPQYMTEKTINKLMEIARLRPKINFAHTFRLRDAEYTKTIESIVNKNREYFAHNLSVQLLLR